MNIELNFCEKGKGETLILLHGNGEDYHYFDNQIAYFSDKYRVIAVDTRGHGGSPRGTAEFSIRQFADDLKSFMDHHGIAKASILGFSDGGNIALIFALKYPERVNKLVLNGANLYGRGVKTRVQLPIIFGYYCTKLFKKWSKEAERNNELLKLMVKDPDINKEELTEINIPTLVIAGNKDMIKTSHARLIGEKIPGAETVIIDGDHFIASKKPNQFNKIVDKFLSK